MNQYFNKSFINFKLQIVETSAVQLTIEKTNKKNFGPP